jgi:CheY-like chemotaxis protein
MILDLFMPDLDGFSLLETLRANPTMRDIPVIVLTAGDLTAEQQTHLNNFCQAMLSKSIDGHELLSHLERVLHRCQNS